MRVATDADRNVAPEGLTEEVNRPLREIRDKSSEQGRITPFGAFLRKSGIDEIPQFINVFRGHMSVVVLGPLSLLSPEWMAGEPAVSKCARVSLDYGKSPGATTSLEKTSPSWTTSTLPRGRCGGT